MRITVVEPDGQGGLFHFAHQLCEALAARGHTVHLITSSDPEIPADDRAGFRLVPAMRLWPRTEVAAPAHAMPAHRRAARHARRAWRGVKLTAAWLRVLWLTRALRSDAVVISMILHPHILFLATRSAPRDVVLAQICHEFIDRDRFSTPAEAAGASLAMRANARMAARLDRIFFLSEATRQEFLAEVPFPPDRTTRIPHGGQKVFAVGSISADTLRARLGIDPSRPVLLFFGNLRPSKGIDDLVEAFAAGNAREIGHLVIAGRATTGLMDVEALARRIDELQLRDRVTIVNEYIPGDLVRPYFEMARAVALPYRTASASGVLHAAYHFARPVVVTAVGGLKEDVLDGRTGLVVPPGEARSLADAIDSLMLDAGRAAALGDAGKALSETCYTWDIAARTVGETLAADLNRRRENADGQPGRAAELQAASRMSGDDG